MNSPGGGPAIDLRRRVERLDGLPLRAATARALVAEPPAPATAGADLDPGWQLRLAGGGDPVATLPWWEEQLDGPVEALDRLWRHGVATALAARRLAEEEGDPDPTRLARAGLLHRLGPWALAAVAPDDLQLWAVIDSQKARRRFEIDRLGRELGMLGRDLAARWGDDPLLIDAAWLVELPEEVGDALAAEPGRLRLLRRARCWADRTPWTFPADLSAPPAPGDARRSWLMGKVQLACRQDFVTRTPPTGEPDLVRAVARLRRENDTLRDERDAAARFLTSFARAGPPSTSDAAGASARPTDEPPIAIAVEAASIRLESQAADRARLAEQVEALARAARDGVERQAEAAQRQLRGTLAEFAAGAGHELNNPLAVVLGRAQLLLARGPDAEAARSLRIIVAQARRAHRILRDLMYVGRPPEVRPRPCEPGRILRGCVADLQAEAEARGVRLTCRAGDDDPLVHLDPEGLRHLADVLVRNALEATPRGGSVRVDAAPDDLALGWTVADTGAGFPEGEGRRLFDPFYCGRQAGRGLGMGLPRAARFVEQCGGTIRWTSHPGRGTTFHVALPARRVEVAPGTEGRAAS